MSDCQICRVNKGTLVYVIPDPYWGYGHLPKLCCDQCKPIGYYDSSHKYDPEQDDYHLGLSTQKPLAWIWSFNVPIDRNRCYDCRNIIMTAKRGHSYVYENAKDLFAARSNSGHIMEIYFCQTCYRARKGINRINLDEIETAKARSLKCKRY